jgi:signal transduction histidine kinase
VRRRILRLAMVTAVLTLLLFGLPLAAAVRLVYLDDERTELAQLAERAAAAVSVDSLHGTDPVELPPTEGATKISVYSTTGRLVAGVGPPAADAASAAALTGTLVERTNRGEILVAAPIRQDEQIVGMVRVTSSTGSANRLTWLTWAGMLALGAVALAAAALLARRQAGRLTRPLTELATAAHSLGDGDFSVRPGRSGVAEIDTAAVALGSTAGRLEDLLTRERAFSANASHQLRTPLTGLRLILESALTGDGTSLRDAASRAIEASERLERTIDELLVIARAQTADRQLLDIDALLDDLYRERIGVLAAQGRALRVERDDHLPAVTASPIAVHQIIAVLVDNATKHGAGTVTIRVRDVGTALAIDVSDEGSGPSESRRDELFQRSDARVGGLGLPLARALAEAEGGRLILSLTGRRTTFTLFLPSWPETTGPG